MPVGLKIRMVLKWAKEKGAKEKRTNKKEREKKCR